MLRVYHSLTGWLSEESKEVHNEYIYKGLLSVDENQYCL